MQGANANVPVNPAAGNIAERGVSEMGRTRLQLPYYRQPNPDPTSKNQKISLGSGDLGTAAALWARRVENSADDDDGCKLLWFW